ncbi:uncharacterized protein LOC135392142 isoform X2 [Ornithodoros turicata]|uniref:uncharacterized protein LOC135392142 isoform X2 n=1 Tax=Ornithodoros turicata TaxID=34597 RepID=UPI00313A2DEC
MRTALASTILVGLLSTALAGFLEEHHLAVHDPSFSQVQLPGNQEVRESYIVTNVATTLEESPAFESQSQAATVAAPVPQATVTAVDQHPPAVPSGAVPAPAQESAYLLTASAVTHARPEYIRQHLPVAAVSPTVGYRAQPTTAATVAPQYAPSNGIQPGAITAEIPLNVVIKSGEAFPQGHLYGNDLPVYRDKPPYATKYFPVFKAFQLALGRRILDPPAPALLPRLFPNTPRANHPRRGNDLHELLHGHHEHGHGRRQHKHVPTVGPSAAAFAAGQGLGHTLAAPGHHVGRPAVPQNGIPTVAHASGPHGHFLHTAYVPRPASSHHTRDPSLVQQRVPIGLQNTPSRVVFETTESKPGTSILQQASVISASGTTVYHHATTVVRQDAPEGLSVQQHGNAHGYHTGTVPIVPDVVFVNGAAAQKVSPSRQEALLSDVQGNPYVQTQSDVTGYGVPPPVFFQTTLPFTKQAISTPTAPGLVLHMDHPVVAVAPPGVGIPAVVDLHHGAPRHIFMAGLGIGHSLSYGPQDGNGWEWRYLDARRRKK